MPTTLALASFGSDEPVPLAERLLFEIRRGMVPVWPSTLCGALNLRAGLAALRIARTAEVDAAVALAPRVGSLDWNELLSPIRH